MIRRLFAAIIALIAWIGLGAQLDASLSSMGSMAKAIWAMLLYFTIIANLAAAIIFTALAAGVSRVASPFIIGGVTIAMVLVGVVYNTLLSGMLQLSGGAKLADVVNHIVTPITVSGYWLFMAEKGHLTWRAPPRWTLLPMTYFVYALARGGIEGTYPYPFMNLAQLGWPQTIANGVMMGMCFAAVGYGMVWLDKKAAPRLN